MLLESVAPTLFARVWNRLGRLANDQCDRLMAMDGDEMVDENACALPRVGTYSGVAGKGR